ncbi:unnamed protein product [Cuscuta epithymum]|uniref:Uncharacterized protein n=1 Tax=Cuscuta epithymum TaxID=186058 RepID=A0AAV0EL04_9ASTE|nr:unnamed protein product [Cuscuta epithymum]
MKRETGSIIVLCFLVCMSISMVAAAKRSARKLAVKSDCQIDIEDLNKTCKQWLAVDGVADEYCEADCILVRTQCSKEEVLKEAPYFFTPVIDKILTKNGFQPFP